jgi:hypothetical protein
MLGYETPIYRRSHREYEKGCVTRLVYVRSEAKLAHMQGLENTRNPQRGWRSSSKIEPIPPEESTIKAVHKARALTAQDAPSILNLPCPTLQPSIN